MKDIQQQGARSGVKDVMKSKVSVLSVVGMFYAICCAGAYGIEEMVPECGPGLTIVMLLVLPIVWAYPYGMICAEMGAIRPVEGGSMIWVKEALGEFWFAIMAFSNVIWGLVCNTVYVVLSISYLGSFVELTELEAYLLKLLLIVIFFIINVLGLKEVSVVSTVLSIIILIAFAACAAVGFLNWNQNPMDPFIPDDVGIFEGIGAGLAIGIWMYSGFDELSLFGGEIKDSSRVIPKALMIVIPLITLTYVLPTLAGLASVGQWESWTTESGGIGYSTILTDNLGAVFGVIFMIVAIIGQCSIFNVCLATGSRCILILSDEHLGPQFFSKLTKKKGSPYVGLIIVAAVSAVLIPSSFDFLVVIDVFFMVIVTALTVIAAFILRKSTPKDEISFKIPGGTPMHTLMCASVLIICILSTLLNGTDWFLGGLLWILVVPILYIICKRIYGGLTVKDPDKYPVNPKTKLGRNDLFKLGGFYMGMGVFALLARWFLQWYEGDWAEEYYIEEWETGLFSDFEMMLTVITVTGIITFAVGIIFWMAGKKFEKF